LSDEISTACVYGELSALERILIFMQQNKDMTKEELEGVLHLDIVAMNNFIAEKVGRKDVKIKLDDYLELRGYYNKKPSSIGLEEMRQ